MSETVKLVVDLERLLLKDLIQLEEGSLKATRDIIDLLSRFVVGDDGEPVESKEAYELLTNQSIMWLNGAKNEINSQLESLGDEALPPE